MITRRAWLRALTGAALGGLGAGAFGRARVAPRVVVVGAGYGGATAAKYLRLFSHYTIEVMLVDPNPQFISAPLSNLVIAGDLRLSDLSTSYSALRSRHGVTLVRDRVAVIDAERKRLTLAGSQVVRYDKLVLAPGVEPMFDAIDGLAQARAESRIFQGWTAGAETLALRRQLEQMQDGGTFVITVPEAPYRCPPGPYERASVVAAYLRRHKPKSKVLVLDANQDVSAMAPLFKAAWTQLYDGTLEYRNNYRAVAVDSRTLTVRFEVQDDVRADVLNVLPPLRAGAVALDAGLKCINGRWCEVDFRTFESTSHPDVHAIGDCIQAAPAMPKSGLLANGHAKVAAAAIVAQLQGLQINPRPLMANTCYAFVAADQAMHSTTVYAYASEAGTFKPVAGTSGASATWSDTEATYAKAAARNVWSDMLK